MLCCFSLCSEVYGELLALSHGCHQPRQVHHLDFRWPCQFLHSHMSQGDFWYCPSFLWHAHAWENTARLIMLKTRGSYSGTYEWSVGYFLTLQITFMSFKGKLSRRDKAPVANNPVVIGEDPICPPTHDAINSIPSLLQALKKLLEFSAWNVFWNKLQSTSFVTFNFWSQYEEEVTTHSSHTLTTCDCRFVLPTKVAAKLVAAPPHCPDVTNLSLSINAYKCLNGPAF